MDRLRVAGPPSETLRGGCPDSILRGVLEQRMRVVGFVQVRRGAGGRFEHLRGTTIACKWPGSAEQWLSVLVQHGQYSGWERLAPEEESDKPLIPHDPPQAEYRGARLFRVQSSPTLKPLTSEPDGTMVMAVWEQRA